jgi:hypothetical protein
MSKTNSFVATRIQVKPCPKCAGEHPVILLAEDDRMFAAYAIDGEEVLDIAIQLVTTGVDDADELGRRLRAVVEDFELERIPVKLQSIRRVGSSWRIRWG